MKKHVKPWILYAMLFFWGLLAFSQLLTSYFGFVRWDDLDMVCQNPLLNPSTLAHLGQIWRHEHLRLYIPLTYTVYWVIARVAGTGVGEAPLFHMVSAMLHFVCALLVMGILSRRCGSRMAGLFGALLFGLHPMQVESVAWIAELDNVLSGALGLGAILVFLIWAEGPHPNPPPEYQERGSERKSKGMVYAAALGLFLLALLAKPSVIVVPVMLLVMEPRRWRSLIPWFALAGIFAVVTAVVQAGSAGVVSPFYDRPLIAVDSMGFYLAKLVWPYPLSIDYARTPEYVIDHGRWVFTGLALLAAIRIVFGLRRKFPSLVTGLLIFAAGLLPVLGLAAFDFQRYSTVADRYVYLAMLGPALAVSGILAGTTGRAAWWVVAALLVIYVGLALPQEETWRDSDALAAHALAVDSGSEIGHKIRGAELSSRGQWAEAIPEYEAALRRNRTDADVHFNLANALMHCGDRDDALTEYLLAAQNGSEAGREQAARLLNVPKP